MRMWHRRCVVHALEGLTLGGALTVLSSRVGSAQELDPRLYPKYEASASGALLVLGENIRVDPADGTGTEIDAEDVLGVSPTSFQPRIAFRWRPGQKHELEFSFLRAVRSSDKAVSKDFVFADTTFTAGLRVNASLRTSQALLTYRYAFRVRPKSQIGAAFGLGAILFRTELDAEAGVTTAGADTAIVPYSRTRKFNAPTGSLGLYGRAQLGEKWYGEADARGIYVKVSNFKGSIAEFGGAVRRFFSNTVAAELGYTLGVYSVTLTHTPTDSSLVQTGFSGKIKYNVHGFRGGLVIDF
jgi:hypothetical protein